MEQIEIPEVAQTKPAVNWLRPPKAETPVFWISEVRILSQLSPDLDHEIRRVPLRKGLNIVWSPPGEVDGDPLQRGRGHAAGKTSFCRAIRYLLGEEHFGNKFITARIADSEKLSRAYLVAQVWLGEVPWTIARPLYHGGRHFSIPNMSIDEALVAEPSVRRSHKDFVEAMEQAVLAEWDIKHFDSNGEQKIGWLHVLQPLTRDQEAHLSSLHSWRVPLSASDSPEVSDSVRPFLMRCLMGLADPRENAELQNRVKALARQKMEDANVHFYARSFDESLETLKETLPDLLKDVQPADELFVDTVTKAANAKAVEKAKRVRAKIERLGLPELRKRREGCIAEIARLQGRIEEPAETLKTLRTRLEAHQAKPHPTPKDDEQLRETLFRGLRRSHHCSVPVDTALEQCPVYWRLGVKRDVEENPAEDYSVDVVTRYTFEIKKLEQELAPQRALIAKLAGEQKDLDAKIAAAVDAEFELNNQLEDIVGDRGDAVRLSQNIVDALRKKTAAHSAIEDAANSIDRSDKELEAIRKDSIDAQERLSAIFNDIVRRIAGDHMRGELRFTKIETNATLFRKGEIVSEAFNAIKALAYDFTALTAWLNGIGHHPGFLLHDSPRESDMEPSLYQPFFHFAANLAEAAPASFQYIVTTTEPPPIGLQSEPPVCLRLDGSKENGSLYRDIL